MIKSASLPRIVRAAIATASSPEPHSRLRVTPPELSGSPARSAAMREVAVVLPRLVGAAEDHVVELAPVDARVAVDQRLDRDRGEIVGADVRQRAAVAADRRADVVADVGFGHVLRYALSLRSIATQHERVVVPLILSSRASGVSKDERADQITPRRI